MNVTDNQIEILKVVTFFGHIDKNILLSEFKFESKDLYSIINGDYVDTDYVDTDTTILFANSSTRNAIFFGLEEFLTCGGQHCGDCQKCWYKGMPVLPPNYNAIKIIDALSPYERAEYIKRRFPRNYEWILEHNPGYFK